MLDVTTIPMSEFALKWRFTDPSYCVLPAADLEKVEPIDALSARRSLDLISRWLPMPPSPRMGFARVHSRPIEGHDADQYARVQEWLLVTGVPRSQKVVVSWNHQDAAITTWETLAKYWNAFWYPSSDDLIAFDFSLAWVLFISHEEHAFFGDVHGCLHPAAASNPDHLKGGMIE